mgnify:FL=1
MDAMMEIDNIGKKFNDQYILQNIKLTINKGEMVALVGKSGSGKTTLLNILGLISAPSSGRYKIKGKSINSINSKQAMILRRNTIGYLFQNYGLIVDETVEWNLRLAYAYKKIPKREQELQINQLLNEFQLEGKGKNKVFQLSGGEQQRVALIKLIIRDCEIILADEPTGSLDAGNRDLVMERLKDMNKLGKTIVIVTHDLNVAEKCNRIVELDRKDN